MLGKDAEGSACMFISSYYRIAYRLAYPFFQQYVFPV